MVWPQIKCEAIKATQARHRLLLRASGNSLAALVLAGPVFLKVKIKFQKASIINISASVIFRLVRLIYIELY